MSAGEFVLSLAVRLDNAYDTDEVHDYLVDVANAMVAGTEALVETRWVRIDEKVDPDAAFEPEVRAVQYRTVDVVVPPRWPHVLEAVPA